MEPAAAWPMTMHTHIGNLIREVFDSQPKSHTVSWFAAQLNCRRGNIYNIFNRPTIDTALLHRICIILEHDFFADLSRSVFCEENDAAVEACDDSVQNVR